MCIYINFTFEMKKDHHHQHRRHHHIIHILCTNSFVASQTSNKRMKSFGECYTNKANILILHKINYYSTRINLNILIPNKNKRRNWNSQ